MALDLSYIIPIFCRRVFHSHPDVMFKPGPFYMGDGWLGFLFNYTCIIWTLFVCVVFSIPTNLPVTKLNMNYSSVRSCPYISKANSLIFLLFLLLLRSSPLELLSSPSKSRTNFYRPLDAHNHRRSVWYFAAAHKHYTGPKSNVNDDSATMIAKDYPTKDEKFTA